MILYKQIKKGLQQEGKEGGEGKLAGAKNLSFKR